MTIRVFFVAVLLFSILFTGGLTPPRSCAAELSRSPKVELLDKAEAALIWFYTLGDEVVMSRIPAQEYRERIAPTELIQAAALLYSYRDAEKTALAEKLLPFLPYYRLTPEEMFEINDLLGDTDLPDLAEIQTSDLGRIAVEANRFRTESLNSAERVVMFQEPTTALELMKAVDVLSGVGRAVFVRHYLRRFLRDEFPVTPEESAKIVETIGTQKLMQIAIHPEFAPLGKEAVAKIIDSAKEHWQDEERIAEALREFVEESGVRSQESGGKEPAAVPPQALPALRVLWKGDQLSVQQVFAKLATIEDEAEADQLVAVLLSIRADMKEALAAALGAENGRLRYYAARGLAASVTPQEAFLLYQYMFSDGEYPPGARETVKNILRQRRITLPSQEQAAAILFERATDYFEKRRPLRIDGDGKVFYWGLVVYVSENSFDWGIEYQSLADIDAAYNYFAHEYYEQSRLIRTTTNYEVRELASAVTLLEYLALDRGGEYADVQVKWFEGNPEPMPLFRASLEKNCFNAAAAVLRYWRDNANLEETDELLKPINGKPSLLVQAVVAPNRNVRFAALEAIMKLTGASATQSPALEPFAGSSLVAETLVWFSKSEGESVILSGHPQTASAIHTANLFLGQGYKTDVATTCRELFERAAASPDVEAVVVDARTPQPPVGQFVQMMRQDARTAEIPIAILSSNERDLNPNTTAQRRNTMTRAERRSPDNPFRSSLSLTYPRLANAESAKWVLDDLFDKTGKEPATVSPKIRLEQAKQALRWLREIKLAELSSGQKIYHFEDFDSVVLHALHSERRVVEGLHLAAVVKSAALQSAIYEMAANVIYPMELREQAGDAFEESIERFGILLRGNQIQRLYDRYNQSESEPVESQELLSRLIDAVEEK